VPREAGLVEVHSAGCTGCEPPRRLLVTLRPGDDDQTVIEAELFAADGRTRLVVEERGLPVDVVALHGAGWQAHIEELAAHLAARPACDWRTRWTELIPKYTEQQADVDR
jgi:hypothetical protein